ncbi:MAG: CvpA family protein, partial [Candidatus Limnocylindria bacterium]
MNLIDAGVLVLLSLGLIAGARAGFLGPVLGLIGAAIGLGLAILLATVFRDQLSAIEQPMRGIATLLMLGAFVIVGEATGAAIGASMSLGVRRAGLRPLDALGGAVVGVAHVVILVWLIGGMLAVGMAPTLGAAARDSV